LDKLTKIFRYKILPIYWAFLTYILLKGGLEKREPYWFEFTNIDKTIHLAIFALLGFCFRVAYPKQKFWIFFQLMLIYALLTEILQDEMALGRSMETLDLVADMLGVLTGYFVWRNLKTVSHKI
jgi:VanZ family protein